MAKGYLVGLGQLIEDGCRLHGSSRGLCFAGWTFISLSKRFFETRPTVGMNTWQQDGILIGTETKGALQCVAHVGKLIVERVPQITDRKVLVVALVACNSSNSASSGAHLASRWLWLVGLLKEAVKEALKWWR